MSVSFALGIAACGGNESHATSGSDASSSIEDVSDDSSSNESSSDDVSDDASDETSSSSPDEDSSSDETADNSSGEDSSSNEETSSSDYSDATSPVIKTQAGYEEDGNTYPELKVAVNYANFSWTDFELVTEPSCTVAGIKAASWTEDESVSHQAYIAPRGHTYENGICACGAGPIYPEAPSTITYTDVTKVPGNENLDGGEYSRYELKEGYYELTLTRVKKWLSFSISEPGQYALYSVGKAHTSIELNRYDASAQYIPIDKDGKHIGFAANNFNGILYSSVNCDANTWSDQWRATFSIFGKAGEVFKFRFVKIGDEAWAPQTETKQIYAQQLTKQIPATPTDATPVTVPYDTEYFYDETSGYYYMGTKENPGELIYVAITKSASRMLGTESFATIQYQAASNLYLSYGTTADGNYLLHDYIPFISGDLDNDMETDLEDCYKNYVNADGLYPVNQELFEFLHLYVNKNSPIDIPDDYKNDPAKTWLAACYYYKALTPGTQELPNAITSTGEIEVESKPLDFVYYSLNYVNTDSSSTITYCTVSCDDANVWLILNDGTQIKGTFSILVETSASKPYVFSIAALNGESMTFTLIITPSYDGSQDDPEIVNVTKGEQTVAMNSIEHLMANGTSTHQKYYTFKIAESGTLKLSSNVAGVLVSITFTNTEGNKETVMLSDWQDIQVKAGDVLEVVVGPADAAIDFNMTISLS